MLSASIQNMVHHMATGGMRPDLTPAAFWPFASKVPTHPNFGQDQTEAELLSNNSGSSPPPQFVGGFLSFWPFFKWAGMPAREGFRPLAISIMLLMLLALIVVPWGVTQASEPTVTVTSDTTEILHARSFRALVTFSEGVKGFDLDDLVIDGGRVAAIASLGYPHWMGQFYAGTPTGDFAHRQFGITVVPDIAAT